MKVLLTRPNIIHSPETISFLLQKRMLLIWNKQVANIVKTVTFKSMSTPYEIVPDGSMYIVNFNNEVLLNLVHSGKGISDFDGYLMEIENHLIWKL